MNPTTINVEYPMTPDPNKAKVSYMRDRLQSVFYSQDEKLQKQYGLRDDDPPSTAQEIVDRIKEGKFVLPKDEDYDDGYYSIRWRDPAKQEDKAGFKAARVFLDSDYIAAKDAIVVKSPEDGLSALQAFETKTYN